MLRLRLLLLFASTLMACGSTGVTATTSSDAGPDAAPDAAPEVAIACEETLAAYCGRMGGCAPTAPANFDAVAKWCTTAGSFGKRLTGIGSCDLYIQLEIEPPPPRTYSIYVLYDRTTLKLLAIVDGIKPPWKCLAGTSTPEGCMTVGVGADCP